MSGEAEARVQGASQVCRLSPGWCWEDWSCAVRTGSGVTERETVPPFDRG